MLAAVPRVMALLKTHLEMSQPGLAERVAGSQGMSAWMRWWRFREVHRAFGLKFWALISGGGALAGPLEQFWNALGFVLVQGYGMTETTALITLNHPFHVAGGPLASRCRDARSSWVPDGEVLVRGPMISGGNVERAASCIGAKMSGWRRAIWPRRQATGELRFLGRKSEMIVTAAGVNIHPEDLEAAIEEQPGVAACAVVAIETTEGPEPCAVLACGARRSWRRRSSSAQMRGWRSFSECGAGCCGRSRICRAHRPARCGARRWQSGWQRVQSAAAGEPGGEGGMVQAGGDWLLALIGRDLRRGAAGRGR